MTAPTPPKEGNRELAERLRDARVAAKKTRQEVADALGCSVSFVKKWETEALSFPRLDQTLKFIELTGADPQRILGSKLPPDVVWVDRFDLKGETLPCPEPVLRRARGKWLAGILRGRGSPVMVVVEKELMGGRHERLAVATIGEALALGWLRNSDDGWEFRAERSPYWNRVKHSAVVGEVIFLGERAGDEL
ncbi:MAG: hypothetical protein A2X76_04280 [Lysobacterales bacterium GWF1_69_6]|jgi:transcriptional regulator with XRE-family HTH domain|nr:MAG: hypothetical protein A2X76_04280 [Xanthomonadales bacterium GWF1_69_6]